MRKILFTLLTIFILLSMSNCDIGLGSDPEIIPENFLAGNSWEQSLKNNDDEVFQYNKLEFTDKNITFNTWLKNNYDKTYTGTYELTGDNNYYILKLTSNEPTMNGILVFSFQDNSPLQEYPKDTIYFTKDFTNNNYDIPFGGIYYKIIF